MSVVSDDFERIKGKVNGSQPPTEEDWEQKQMDQENAGEEDTTLYDALTDLISTALDDDNAARLAMGEAGAVLKDKFGYGELQRAATETHVVYKTLAERVEVVEFYEAVSAGQKVTLYESTARELLAENPTLQWTHLRDARRLGDLGKAKAGLQKAVKEGYTPTQFQKYVQDILGKPKREKLCRGCRFWGSSGKADDGKEWGDCQRVYEAKMFELWMGPLNDEGQQVDIGMNCREDFGCNQWEKKS